jgi:hypothetical protein
VGVAGERDAVRRSEAERTRRIRNTAEPNASHAGRDEQLSTFSRSHGKLAPRASTAPLSLAPIPAQWVILGNTGARARSVPFTDEPSRPDFSRCAASNRVCATCERMRSRSTRAPISDPHRRMGRATKALENRCLKTCFQKRNGLSICSCHPYYGLIVCGGGC